MVPGTVYVIRFAWKEWVDQHRVWLMLTVISKPLSNGQIANIGCSVYFDDQLKKYCKNNKSTTYNTNTNKKDLSVPL